MNIVRIREVMRSDKQQDKSVRLHLKLTDPELRPSQVINTTLCLKKRPTFKLSLTLSNLNRFLKSIKI